MSDHLPECPVAGIKPTAYDYAERAYYDCICDRLRDCEARALSAARDAVAALNPSYVYKADVPWLTRSGALAAIDALRGDA